MIISVKIPMLLFNKTIYSLIFTLVSMLSVCMHEAVEIYWPAYESKWSLSCSDLTGIPKSWVHLSNENRGKD